MLLLACCVSTSVRAKALEYDNISCKVKRNFRDVNFPAFKSLFVAFSYR